MAGRLAVDFGTSNTVVAVWDDATDEARVVHIPEFGSIEQVGDDQVSLVPSLINYVDEQRRWIGQQVRAQNLYHSGRTFRWMKRYIANRSPVRMRIDGMIVSYFDAGRDFLSSILYYAAEELQIGDEEIALTVPVEAFEHYENWLSEVTEAAGLPRYRLIDEPSAAALGYNAHIKAGDVYLIFDFGGGTLDVAAVMLEDTGGVGAGRRCRVLGKAGAELGGTTIDQWMFQDVLKRNKKHDSDEDVRAVSNRLLSECMLAKERLSSMNDAGVSVMLPNGAGVLAADFTRSEFEALLDRHNAIALIDQTIRRCLNALRERGFGEDAVRSVLLVGGSSQIPIVQQTLRRIFGTDRILMDRPMDAVARGAAAFAAGVDFFDYIQHDYAIGYVNREKGCDDFLTLVEAGTQYPSDGPLKRLTIKAHYDGQIQMGLKIFELGEPHKRFSGQGEELIFDLTGAARIAAVNPEEDERRTRFWMNEHNPTFLNAEPPAKQGERRFEVEFSIDANKRLLFTAKDLISGKITHQDYPVVKLT